MKMVKMNEQWMKWNDEGNNEWCEGTSQCGQMIMHSEKKETMCSNESNENDIM